MKKCGSKNSNNCLSYQPHECSRPKGHKGKHRCYIVSTGKWGKPRAKPSPCSKRW